MSDQIRTRYKQLLFKYLVEKAENQLYQAQLVSKEFIEQQINPEEALLIHLASMKEKAELPAVWEDSFQFFLEFMVQYGLAHQEREALLHVQRQLETELSLAADVQQSLLPDIEDIDFSSSIDIGVISMPARKVSGDFYNITPYEQGIEIAVADISGKSVPAAILMSMIKFAMDGMIDDYHHPHTMLERLNRFIYKNSEPSQFVTMFWGDYDEATYSFGYSNAGHEPALLYRHSESRFIELTTEGCALGISTRFGYETKSVYLEPGDFILLYTDGIIETRERDRIDDSSTLQQYLRGVDLTQSAQQIVEQLYHQVLGNNAMEVVDDQTLLLLKRN